MERADAERMAAEWVDGWNRGDVESVLAHYADDVVVASPLAESRGFAGGKVRGKDAVRGYYAAGLAARPALRFTAESVLVGTDAFTILYHDERGVQIAETIVLADGLGVRVMANYGPLPPA